MSNYSIGKQIRSLRKKQNLSQEQLALMAEITTAYLGQIEREEKNPTIKLVEKISNVLGISLSQLFSEQKVLSFENQKHISQINYLIKDLSEDEKQN